MLGGGGGVKEGREGRENGGVRTDKVTCRGASLLKIWMHVEEGIFKSSNFFQLKKDFVSYSDKVNIFFNNIIIST